MVLSKYSYLFIPALLMALLAGCGDNSGQSSTYKPHQQQKAAVKNPETHQGHTSPEPEKPVRKYRTVSMFHNGKEFVGLDIDPPLKNTGWKGRQ